jgi:hypothetical protein
MEDDKELIEHIERLAHEEHEEWSGSSFNPEAVDLAAVNRQLGQWR